MSLLNYHFSFRDLRRFSFYMIHTIKRLLPSRKISLFLSRSHTFHLLILSHFPSFILLHHIASFSSSLSRSLGSFFALSESLRRDLNSSLPAPFPDFSSVKSALRCAPAPSLLFSSRSPRQFVRIRPCPIIGSRYYHNCP